MSEPLDFTALCARHITNKHATLWGSSFEVVSPEGLDEAAAWFAQQVVDLMALADQINAQQAEPVQTEAHSVEPDEVRDALRRQAEAESDYW